MPARSASAKFGGAERHDHELLHFEAVVGVRAAVQDVHERRGERARVCAAEVAPERQAHGVGRGARHGHRHAEQRVRAELGLGGRAVGLEQHLVDRALIERVHAHDGRPEHRLDVGDRLGDPFAEVALGVAVAQLERFVLARRCARRDRRAAVAARRSALRLRPWGFRESRGSRAR